MTTVDGGLGSDGPARRRRVRQRAGGALATLMLLAIVGSWIKLGTTSPIVMVQTGSMVPTLHIGDVALLESLHGRAPKVGEIVVEPVPLDVQRNLHYPANVTHRVMKITNGMVTTKGDANAVPEPFSVPISKIHTRLVTVIPGAGRFLRFMVSPFGIIWLVVGGVLFLGPKVLELMRDGVTPLPAVAGAGAGDNATLDELVLAVREYGQHLQSHTAIVQAMAEASRQLSSVAARLELRTTGSPAALVREPKSLAELESEPELALRTVPELAPAQRTAPESRAVPVRRALPVSLRAALPATPDAGDEAPLHGVALRSHRLNPSEIASDPVDGARVVHPSPPAAIADGLPTLLLRFGAPFGDDTEPPTVARLHPQAAERTRRRPVIDGPIADASDRGLEGRVTRRRPGSSPGGASDVSAPLPHTSTDVVFDGALPGVLEATDPHTASAPIPSAPDVLAPDVSASPQMAPAPRSGAVAFEGPSVTLPVARPTAPNPPPWQQPPFLIRRARRAGEPALVVSPPPGPRAHTPVVEPPAPPAPPAPALTFDRPRVVSAAVPWAGAPQAPISSPPQAEGPPPWASHATTGRGDVPSERATTATRGLGTGSVRRLA